MRLALISDQHGNDVAFQAALEDVERLGVDEVVCLGDVVQGGTQPAADARPSRGARLRDRARQCGRVPARSADGFAGGGHRAATRGARLDAVAAEPRAARADPRLHARRPPRARRRRCCSSSTARRPRTRTSCCPSSAARRSSRSSATTRRCSAGGHTHLQWTRRIGDALYVNPGSVGLSYDRHPDPPVLRALAEWALVTVEDGAVAVEFRQVPYSVEDFRAAAEQSGRPHADEWVAQLI